MYIYIYIHIDTHIHVCPFVATDESNYYPSLTQALQFRTFSHRFADFGSRQRGMNLSRQHFQLVLLRNAVKTVKGNVDEN